MRENIKILTDSTSSLTKEEQQEYGITLVNLSVNMNGKTVRDLDLDIPRFYAEMEESKILPTTSQPSVGDFMETFDGLTQDGSTVIAILISSKLSGSFDTACQAAAQLKGRNIYVFDSLSAGQVLANMAIEAAHMTKEGKTAKEILKSLEEIRKHSDVYIVVNDLTNLLKGGRIHHISYRLANLLKIKPIVYLKEGRLELFSKVRTVEKGIKAVIEEAKRLIGSLPIEQFYIMFGHTNHPAGAECLYRELKKFFPTVPKNIMEVTPVVGVHLGAGSLGLIVSKKRS